MGERFVSRHVWLDPIFAEYCDRLGEHRHPSGPTCFGEVFARNGKTQGLASYTSFTLQYGLDRWPQWLSSFGSRLTSPVIHRQALIEIGYLAVQDKLKMFAADLLTEQLKATSPIDPKAVEYHLCLDGPRTVLSIRQTDAHHAARHFARSGTGWKTVSLQDRHYLPKDDQPWFTTRISTTFRDKPPREQIKLKYDTAHMPDDNAREVVGAVLLEIRSRLSRIAPMVCLMASPHYFNDAAGDENWQQVLIGTEDGHKHWHNGTYFQKSVQAISALPPGIDAAIGVLAQLQTLEPRDMLQSYLGRPAATEQDVLMVAVDADGMLIAMSPSNDSGGPVWRIGEAGLPKLVGQAEDDIHESWTWDRDAPTRSPIRFKPLDDVLADPSGLYSYRGVVCL